jgi:hypothetical protein
LKTKYLRLFNDIVIRGVHQLIIIIMAKTYKCKRCCFESNFKHVLHSHLLRKTQCTVLLANGGQDIPATDLLLEITTKKEIERKYKCEWCDKSYTQCSNRNRHKATCLKKPLVNASSPNQNSLKQIFCSGCKIRSKDVTFLQTPHSKEYLELRQENQRLRNELIKYKKHRTEEFYQVIVENWLGGTHSTNEAGVTDVTNGTTHAEIKGWKEWKYAMGQLLAYQAEDAKEHLYACMFGNYDNEYKKKAIKVLNERGISCYEFAERDGVVSVMDASNGGVVYSYDLKHC